MVPGLVCLILLFFVPIAQILSLSLTVDSHLSLGNYVEFFGVRGYVKSLYVTIQLAVGVALICAVIGYIVGYQISRMQSRVASIMLLMVVVPFWTSILIRGFAMQVLLIPGGLVQRVLATLHVVDW